LVAGCLAPSPPLGVTDEIAVGTRPCSVAVDPAAGTAYVANASDGTVSVVDLAARDVAATITVGTKPNGVAVDPSAGVVHVANTWDRHRSRR
jgi:YVTN family beta-propeller protein